jgi:semaphorin 6
LMDMAVPSTGDQPIFVKTSLHERLTAVAVDPGVKTPGDDSADQYDVIYVGTTKGKVLKIISTHSIFGEYTKPVIAEEIQVYPYHVAVNNLQVINDRLIVVSDHEVKSMPLHRCSAIQVQSCNACVQLRDPHCAWNVVSGTCVDKTLFANADASELLQDIYHGRHPACSEKVLSTVLPTESNIVENRMKLDYVATLPAPAEELDVIVTITNDPMLEPRTGTAETLYTSSSMITAALVTALMCLLVGFFAGFLVSRKCNKDDYKSCGHHYLEHHLHKQNDSTTTLRNDAGYTPTPCNNLIDHSKNNLLVNLPTKTEVEKNNINSSTNSSSGSASSTTTTATTVIHNGTLPRNGTLCKKVYL